MFTGEKIPQNPPAEGVVSEENKGVVSVDYDRESVNDADHQEGAFMWIKNKRRASGAAAETYRNHFEAKYNAQEKGLDGAEKDVEEDNADKLHQLSEALDDNRSSYVAKRMSLMEKTKRLGEKLGLDVHSDLFKNANEELDAVRASYAKSQEEYYDAIVQDELGGVVDRKTAEIFVRSLNISEGANMVAAEDAARMEKHPLAAYLRKGVKTLVDKYRSVDWKHRVAAGAVASLVTGGASKAFSLASVYSGLKDKLDARAEAKEVQDIEQEVAFANDVTDVVQSAIGRRRQFAKDQERAQAKRRATAAAIAAGTTVAGSAIGNAVSDVFDGNNPVRSVDELTDPNGEVIREADTVKASLDETWSKVQSAVESGPSVDSDDVDAFVEDTQEQVSNAESVSNSDVESFLDGTRDISEITAPSDQPVDNLSPEEEKMVDQFLETGIEPEPSDVSDTEADALSAEEKEEVDRFLAS